MLIYLEAIDTCQPVRKGNAADLEKLADLLDITVVNLKDANMQHELPSGSCYNKIQTKLYPQLLTQYQWWRHEHGKTEEVEALLE